MTKIYRSALAVTCAIIGFFILMGWTGDCDYCEYVILHMSQEQYDYVKQLLTDSNGCEPSDREIAHYWADHSTK